MAGLNYPLAKGHCTFRAQSMISPASKKVDATMQSVGPVRQQVETRRVFCLFMKSAAIEASNGEISSTSYVSTKCFTAASGREMLDDCTLPA